MRDHGLVLGAALEPFTSIQYVFEDIPSPKAFVAHTGTASAITMLRNFSGSAFGVSTSMATQKLIVLPSGTLQKRNCPHGSVS